MKTAAGPPPPHSRLDVEAAAPEPPTKEEPSAAPKTRRGSERVTSCPPHCSHGASLPSDVLIEMKVGVHVGQEHWPSLLNGCSAKYGIVFAFLSDFFFAQEFSVTFNMRKGHNLQLTNS